MGFFKKLFRRRKKKKDNGAFLTSGNMAFGHDNIIRKPAFDKKTSAKAYDSFRSPPTDRQNSKSNTPGKKGTPKTGSHDSSYGSSFDSSKDSYNRSRRTTSAPQAEDFSIVPFEADFSEFNNENNVNYANHGSPMNVHGGASGGRNNRPGNLLNYEQVQKFEQQQQQTQQGYANPYGQPPPKKLQLTRLPSGQLVAMNSAGGRGAASPLSVSSDFDLSTDAEDNEYNRIREFGMNGRLSPMLGSPGSGSEDDKMLRPTFSSFDRQDSRKNKFYLSNSESEYESFNEGGAANRSRHYFSDSDNDRDSQGGITPSSKGGGGLSPKYDSKFTFDTVGLNQSTSLSPGTHVVSPGTKSDREPSPRTIAIQQAKQMKNVVGKDTNNDLYADSSDSENDTKDNRDSSRKSPPKDTKSPSKTSRTEGIIENFVDFENNKFGSTKPLNNRQTQSVADPMSPVSELLAQARKSRNNSKGMSSASVNSAPNINDGRPHVPRPANSASSIAREKLMRRRREKKEWLRSNGGDSDDEDDESENGKDNDSWLYNEVTGALGPQGIQADLESLGERSFRSRTSAGNRSLRSHKSHKSNSRRNKSSDASVGSRHSRASRASRASRYSIKSTKSHLSTMSAESRSVANDLIRLEMQLAMVGANKRGENTLKKELEAEAEKKGITGLNVNRNSGNGSVAGSSVGGRSKSSSRSNSSVPSRPIVSNRQKTIVKAPPGKLGIILANKNDARGTVVSGVRTTSVLAHQISPGDRIIAIDGEDVSRMNVTEITSIMARKSDYERTLTILSSN